MTMTPTTNQAYTVELKWGEIESVSGHPSATEALAEIDRAKKIGWCVGRILRDYVRITEPMLLRDVEQNWPAALDRSARSSL